MTCNIRQQITSILDLDTSMLRAYWLKGAEQIYSLVIKFFDTC